MAKYLPDMRVGDDYSIQLTVNNTDTTPVDVTGYKFWLTLKADYTLDDTLAALQFSTTAGDNANDDLLNGKVFLYVPGSLTKTVLPGQYYYDIQQKSSTGGLSTVLPPIADYRDRLLVVPEVTQTII